MALPINNTSQAGTTTFVDPGGKNVVFKDGPLPGSQTGPTIIYYSNAGLEPSFFGGPTFSGSGAGNSGSGSYSFGIWGKPRANGIEKALGALGTALAIVEGVRALSNIGAVINSSIDAIKAIGQQFGDLLLGKVNQSYNNTAEAIRKATTIQLTNSMTPSRNDWRVRIGFAVPVGQSFGDNIRALKETNGVVFPFTPQISVTHKANYTPQDPVHSNFPFQGYKNSQVDDIQISGTWAVNTAVEGQYYLAATQFLKTATKMFYGSSFPNGSPPMVCRLYGYGRHMFSEDGVPVVVKSVSIELPKNVQYKRISHSSLNSETGPWSWVPMESTINVTVSPVYQRNKLRSFSLNDYMNGDTGGII